MGKFTRIILLALICAVLAAAQIPIADRFNSASFAYKGVPGTSATISTTTFYISGIVVVNKSGGQITFRLRDRSTDCSGAACMIVPDDITVPDGGMYVINLPYIEATSGATWACSSATGVTLRIVGTR